MNVEKIANAIDANIVVNSDAEIERFYAGDFLSRVMGSAPSDSCWLTIMNNINVAGVAVLAEIKIIVLCEDVMPLLDLKSRCEVENIALLTTKLGIFEASAKLGNL